MPYRLKCTNGHDRCYLGPDEDCPYCERVKEKPVNIDDEIHQILSEALGRNSSLTPTKESKA